MFGHIVHLRIQSGHETDIQDLLDEWKATIRPAVPGSMLFVHGRSASEAGMWVVLALAQDEQTFRQLYASPGQDAWFRRLLVHAEGEPTWEEVEMEYLVRD